MEDCLVVIIGIEVLDVSELVVIEFTALVISGVEDAEVEELVWLPIVLALVGFDWVAKVPGVVLTVVKDVLLLLLVTGEFFFVFAFVGFEFFKVVAGEVFIVVFTVLVEVVVCLIVALDVAFTVLIVYKWMN